MRSIDVPPGTVFGRLTVIEEAPRMGSRKLRAMLCRCECGTVKAVGLNDLRKGGTMSCGKVQHLAIVSVPPGTVFGHLTVIRETRLGDVRAMLCQCDCGRQKTVKLGGLRSGRTKACGAGHGVAADAAWLNPGEVPLYGKDARGRVAVVDLEDYDLVMQYRWHVQDQERRREGRLPLAYAKTYTGMKAPGGRKHISMHTLITGFAEVDHWDGNGLNNRRDNLRDATHAQNMGNARKQPGCSSQFKGVYWSQRRTGNGKWQAYIGVNHRTRYLGRFEIEEDAARAYDAAAVEAWGEFAWLNFPA
jgi:HNH endonuclease